MERRQIYLELIGVIRHVLLGEPMPLIPDWEPLIRLASAHKLIGFVYRAAVGNSDVPAAMLEQVEAAYFAAVGAQVRQDHFAGELFAALRARELPYMPLKGYCLRELYPEPNWRMAQDLDILVSEEAREEIDAVLTPLGFSRERGEKGDRYTLDRVRVSVYTEIPEEDVMRAEGETLRDSLVTEDGILYRFTPTALYAALLSRMCRNFDTGEGIGIRSVLDLHMCRSRLSESEREAVHAWAQTRGIAQFVRAMEALADAWFGDGESTNDLIILGSYIAAGATVVGTADAEETKKTGRLRRIFPRYASMKRKYPFLKYLPFLLPLFWVARWLSLPFSKRAAESVTATEDRREKMLARVREITGLTAGETAGTATSALPGENF